MAVAQDIITQAFIKIGTYAPTDEITSSDLDQGLTVLNDMLDMWSNESLVCYAILEQTGTIQAGVSSYTIGTGGVFNMTRPLRLISGLGAAYLLDSNSDKYMLNVVERDEWNIITQPNTNSDLPSTIFYDPQFPLGVINVYPTPYQSFPIYFDSYLQLGDFASLSATVSLPPGYKKALQDNLAIELCSSYKPDGFQIPQQWTRAAGISKGTVKRINTRLMMASFDPAITAKPRGSWNIYTNDYNR